MAVSTELASAPEPTGAADTSAELEFRMLGTLEVLRRGAPVDLGGRRQRALLAILLLSAGRVLPADVLIDRLWGDDPPPSAPATLHAYLSNLRRALEPDRAPREPARLIASVRPGYTLDVGAATVDAVRFVELAGEGHRALASGDATTAAVTLRQALELWHGPALADFADEPFAVVEVTRLEEAHLQALEDRVEADLRLGRHQELVAELTALVATHPLRERIRGQLMLALYRSGRQSDALDVARSGREILAEELGLDPDPAIRELEERILRQDPGLAAPGSGEPAPVSVADPDLAILPPGSRDVSAAPLLVDRTGEVGVVDRALGSARGGHGRIVLIGGEPGIGKTHLVECHLGHAADVLVGWGRSHDGEGAPAFWPWRQVLREIAGEIDDDTLRSAVARDAAVVADAVPELAARLHADEPAAAMDAGMARFRFFDAATRLLVRVATERPVAVVLEDIHWADAASLELLRFLASAMRASGIVVVATYRDVGPDGGVESGLSATLADLARLPHAERLVLVGLSRDGVGAVIERVLGHPPADELVGAIHARTDGNPLFVTHLARLLLADPDAVVDGVPPEVADLIGWRVAALPEATRALLAAASVVGRDFDLGLLVVLLDSRSDSVLALVEPAVRAGLVTESEVPGRFRFTHALIRDAIHADAGTARVAQLHGQIGDALAATRADDRDLATIAEHYWRAASVGWADEAVTYALAAAERAAVANASEEEGRHLGRALELVRSGPAIFERDRRELEIQVRLARHHMRVHGYGVPAVHAATVRARELAASLDAGAEHLVATWGLAAHLLVKGAHAEALDVAMETIAAAGSGGNPVVALAGHQIAGVPLFYLGRFLEAADHLSASLAVARELPGEVLARFPQNVEVGNVTFLMLATWLAGDATTAGVLCAEALETADRLGGYDKAFTYSFAAQLAVFEQDPERALTLAGTALDVCAEIGYRHVAAGAGIMHGWALSLVGDTDAGIAAIERGTAYYAEAQEEQARKSYSQTLYAEALLRAGRPEDALAAADLAVGALESLDERFYAPEIHRVRAQVLAQLPGASDVEVRQSLEEAVRWAIELDSPPLRERAERALASATGDQ